MPFEAVSVEKEYEKDKNLRREDVQALAEWARKQPHLPEITELQLVLFLHKCYYHQEAAKRTIDNFFTIRTLHPDLFGCMSVEDVEEQLAVCSMNFLPQMTPEGYSVVLVRLLGKNRDSYRHVAQINLGDSLTMLDLMQKGTRNGLVLVYDLKLLSFSLFNRFNLTAARKYLYYTQEALPLRIKGLHMITASPAIDKWVTLFKHFLKKEFVEMMHFHNKSLESLYQFVPKECLPEDYGGEAPPLAQLHEQTKKNLLANMDLFRWLETQKIDSNKRPPKDEDPDWMFGAAGSFKQLGMD